MKRLVVGTVAVLALAAGAGVLLRQQAPSPGRVRALRLPDAQTRIVTRRFLLYFIVPLWLSAGLADWTRHRATHIETTTGAKETLIHLLMLAEMGVPILAGLFLEINAPVLALMIGAFLVHEATALWDVSYAVTRRKVTPLEQHIHSFLEMLPLMAVSFISVLHWPSLLALVGLRRDRDPRIRLKRKPLPVRYVSATLAAVATFELLPYLEELWRDWRAYPGALVPPRDGRGFGRLQARADYFGDPALDSGGATSSSERRSALTPSTSSTAAPATMRLAPMR